VEKKKKKKRFGLKGIQKEKEASWNKEFGKKGFPFRCDKKKWEKGIKDTKGEGGVNIYEEVIKQNSKKEKGVNTPSR